MLWSFVEQLIFVLVDKVMNPLCSPVVRTGDGVE